MNKHVFNAIPFNGAGDITVSLCIPIYVKRIQLPVISAQLRKELMGEFTLSVETSVYDINPGDVIQVEYNNTLLSFDVKRVNNGKIEAEHISYRLRGKVLQDKYINIPPTYDDRLDFAAIRLNDLIIALNPLYVEVGFEILNQSTSDVEADISFSGDNLLSALQKISEAYHVEYYVTDSNIIFKDAVGSYKGEIKVGYDAKTISFEIDKSDLVTRIYPVGSSENLPEGYYYDRLRPTTFNVESKQHSGVLYVEDTQAIEEWGLVEKIVDFSDVSVMSRRGVIEQTGIGTVQKYNMTFPYVQSSSLVGIKDEKALTCVLFIVQGLNAAELQIVHVDSGSGMIYYSPYLKDGSTLSWTPAAGDKFVLVGYIDQPEMDEARDKLIEAANVYLTQYSKPKMKYELGTVYKTNLQLDIGDGVTIKDPELLSGRSLNEQLRIMSFTYDFVLEAYSSLSLSNEKSTLEDYLWRETLKLRDSLEAIRRGLNKVTQTSFPNALVLEATPNPPSELVAVWGQDSSGIYVELSWSAVENVIGYRVRYSFDNQSFTYLTDTTITSARFYVDAGSTVYIGVASISANNNLSSWKTTSITVGSTLNVSTPTIQSLSTNGTIVFVSLDYPLNALKNILYFQLEASTSSTFGVSVQHVTQSISTSFDVNSLITESSATIYVRARAISKTSTPSAWSSVRTTTVTKSNLEPAAPSNLQLVAGVDHLGAYVRASWTAPASSVDYYIVGYSYDNMYFVYLPPVTTTSSQFYVTAGSIVYVRVASSLAGRTSTWLSASTSVPTGLILPAPTGVTAKGIFTDVQVTFEFPKDKLSYVNGFEVEVSSNSLFIDAFSKVITGTVGIIKADQFLQGNESTVYVRVRTIARTGEVSNWSATASTTISKIKGTYIAEATIDSAHIKEAAIKSVHIDKGVITSAHIGELDASKITSGYISADRIAAGSLSVEKLESTIYLTSRTIIAGTSERNFTLDKTGIKRIINRGGRVFNTEIGTILKLVLISIPPSGVCTYTLPEPLLLEDVEVFLQPLSFPVSRAGVPADESWSYKLGYEQVGLNQLKIHSYISKDVDRTRIMNGVLIPTGSWYSQTTGAYTERALFYIQENFFPGYTEHYFSHAYSTLQSYTIKIRWTGVGGNPSCEVQIDWGDGSMSKKTIGSWLTTGIYAWCYVYNYSATTQRYYVPGDALLMLIDRRD